MTQTRTSTSHPLLIAPLPLPGGGELGLTLCPGKVQPDALTGPWRRDLGLDLDAVADWGAVAVLTLMRDHELQRYEVANIGDETNARLMAWLHLPIDDGGVPDAAFEQAWAARRARLLQRLGAGAKVLLHCRGGLGRTGLVAAMLRLESEAATADTGLDDPDAAADDAMKLVRKARPGAIENAAQEAYIRRYAAALAE